MKRKNCAKRVFFSFAVFVMSISVLVFTFTCRMRPVITRYSETVAERILLNSTNKAVAEVLAESETAYNDIVKTERNAEGNVTSLHVDTVKINLLQCYSNLNHTLAAYTTPPATGVLPLCTRLCRVRRNNPPWRSL